MFHVTYQGNFHSQLETRKIILPIGIRRNEINTSQELLAGYLDESFLEEVRVPKTASSSVILWSKLFSWTTIKSHLPLRNMCEQENSGYLQEFSSEFKTEKLRKQHLNDGKVDLAMATVSPKCIYRYQHFVTLLITLNMNGKHKRKFLKTPYFVMCDKKIFTSFECYVNQLV